MQNIDNAFSTLETNIPAVFNPGINHWRAEHKTGDHVLDARCAFQINATHRVAVVVSNVLNREYAIRPLSIEEPRITTIQYVLTL